MRALGILLMLALLPAVLGVRSANAQHGAPPAAGAEAARADALAISQAALGRRVGDYMLLDTDGRPRPLADYRGKPLVVSLVYTSCYHICPTITRHLAGVIERAQDALGTDRFAVITVGFDAARDTPQAMREFARSQRVAAVRWDFLAGDATAIAGLARDLGFRFTPSGGGFEHLLQTSILDADGIVRRQVYGMDYETPVLIDPLERLVFGEQLGESFLARMGNKFRLFCTVYDPAADRYRVNYTIIAGIAVGVVIGALCLLLLAREWRYSARAARESRPD